MRNRRTINDIDELEELARGIRIRLITLVARAEAGHLGGSLSAVELLTALYFSAMRIDPEDPSWEDRDRFVLSKGHAAPAYYTVLSAAGYFPDSVLSTYDQLGSALQGHPDMRRTPGVDMTSGSLGQGFSAALGMCIGRDAAGKAFHVYVVTGDGEMQEGQVWEAAMYAGAHAIPRFTCIVDCNELQLSSRVEAALSVQPLADKWRSFGWHVEEIDAHDMRQVLGVLGPGRSGSAPRPGPPLAVLAHTVKGKGVSFMENEIPWHSKTPTRGEVLAALEELGASAEKTREWR